MKEDSELNFNEFDDDKFDIHGNVKQFINPLMKDDHRDEEEDTEKLFQEKIKLKYKIQILIKNKLKTVNKLNTLLNEKDSLQKSNEKLQKLMGLN